MTEFLHTSLELVVDKPDAAHHYCLLALSVPANKTQDWKLWTGRAPLLLGPQAEYTNRTSS